MSDAGREGLDALAGRLDGLGERPVAEHADLLDVLHRRLAGELDALGRGRAEPGA